MTSPPGGRRRRLILNTIANIAGQSWAKLLAFLIVPWLFDYLGKDRYAVYALAFTVVILSTLFDPGLRYGCVKIFAEQISRGRRSDLRKLVGAALGFYAVLGAVLFLAAFLFIEPILKLAGIAPQVWEQARFFFLALFAWLMLTQSFSVFLQLLNAAQRMTLSNILGAAAAVFHYGMIIVAIVNDWGLRGIGLVFIAAAIFEGVLYAAAAPFVLRGVRDVEPARPLRELAGYLFGFSWRVKVAVNCNTLSFHVDKLFISHFVGFQAPGLYQLGSTLAIVLRDFVRQLVSALLPVTTDLAARSSLERMREINRLTSRVFFLLSAPCFFFVGAMAPSVIAVWVGKSIAPPDLKMAAIALALLSVAFCANTAMAASMEVASGLHLPQLLMRSALLASILNIVLNFILVIHLGFIGPPLASILSLTIGSLYYGRLISRALGDRPGAFLRQVFLKPLLAAGIPAALLAWWNWRSLAAQVMASGRWSGLAILAVCFAGYLVLYSGILLLSGHVRRSDFTQNWK